MKFGNFYASSQFDLDVVRLLNILKHMSSVSSTFRISSCAVSFQSNLSRRFRTVITLCKQSMEFWENNHKTANKFFFDSGLSLTTSRCAVILTFTLSWWRRKVGLN